MKLVACSLFFVVASSAIAFPGIPDGTYVGKGRMKVGAAFDRVYSAKLVLRGNALEATYDYGDGKVVPYRASINPTSSLEFDVITDGKTIGRGYCDDGLCHLDVPEHKAEETWFFQKGSLVRVGSMLHGADKLVYTEKLAPSNADKTVLECEGFEYSDTKKVRIIRTDDGATTLIEIQKGGKELKRALTKEEIEARAYPISAMYGMGRKIVHKESGWVVSYSCGEDRPLTCRE